MHWVFVFFPSLHDRVNLWSVCQEDRDLKEIAGFLRSRSTSEEKLFIWGSRAELFWLADRQPAIPSLDYDVTADVPHGAAEPETCREIVGMLRLSRPRYIIDLNGHFPLEHFSHFGGLITEDYRLETSLRGARLFRLKD